jgi:transposase
MSQHIRGISREQVALLPAAVEDYVGTESLPRVIDGFVKGLDLKGLGFVRSEPAHTGRPGYAADDLLKLYLYGYWNKIRSSRRLEAECKRNLELMWLVGQLTPDYKSIAEFRKLNSKAFQQACSQFTSFLRDASLIGGEAPVVAIDGSRFKAHAAKASLVNAEQLAKEQQRTARRVAEYLAQLDQADSQEAGQAEPDAAHIRKALERLKARAAALEKAKVELEKSKPEGKTRVGLTDPDSVMLTKNGSTVVGYNVQQAVDSQHKLIVAHEVTTEHNDHTSLQSMATQAKQALQVETLTVITDTGYANGAQAEACEKLNITPVVPQPKVPNTRHAEGYTKAQFTYDKTTDTWCCPAGQLLTRYKRDHAKQTDYYQTKACADCAQRAQCTEAKQRSIARSWHAEAMERADARAKANPALMRLRSATAEHPFGNLKAMLEGGFLVRTLPRVKGEMALGVLTYNLKRVLAIMGFEKLMQKLQATTAFAAT